MTYRRSNTLRCFVKKRVLYMDTTLESPLNGRRRCKGHFALISQARGQSIIKQG